MKPEMHTVGLDAHYVVFNGWVNGRRQKIFSTHSKELAEAELAHRLAGGKPNIKR